MTTTICYLLLDPLYPVVPEFRLKLKNRNVGKNGIHINASCNANYIALIKITWSRWTILFRGAAESSNRIVLQTNKQIKKQ